VRGLGFKEYLEDYEAKEFEELEKFIKKFKEGKTSRDDRYPPTSRFIKVDKKALIAYPPPNSPVWCIIPFYDTTVVPLHPSKDKKSFDRFYQASYGFTSRHIDRIVDEFIKGVGRMQFAINAKPTLFENLEFLEPVFRELKPPYVAVPAEIFIDEKRFRELSIEYDTLASFGLNSLLTKILSREGVPRESILGRLKALKFYYVGLKVLGYDKITDKLGDLMISNPIEAYYLHRILGDLIVIPTFDPLRPIRNVSVEDLRKLYGLGEDLVFRIKRNIVPEIGRFILRKQVLYPETMDGCLEVIQRYDAHKLRNVLRALDEGVKRKEVDLVKTKREELDNVLQNIWDEAEKIKRTSKLVEYGISAAFGLIGELASPIPGIGVLASFGFNAISKIVGMKLGKRIAKFIYPNYLFTIFDFRDKHKLKD